MSEPGEQPARQPEPPVAPAWVNVPIRFTGFHDEFARTKLEYLMSPRALAALIRDTRAALKVRLPLAKLATFGEHRTAKGSLRSDDNVLEVCGCECDYDSALNHYGRPIDFAEARQVLKRRGIRAILATSPSHFQQTKNNPHAHPRWRIWAPFSQPIEPIEREQMVARLAGAFADIGCTFAGESYTLSQSFYIGAIDGSPYHRVLLIDGEPIDRRTDLDEIAVGKPATPGRANGAADPAGDTPDALLAAIVSTETYHPAVTALAGIWAAQRKPLGDALTLIRTAFHMVPEAQRDGRWQARYEDVARCVQDIFHKHLNPAPNAPVPKLREPAGVLDIRRYALAAVRQARERIGAASPDEREALLRVEARALARFVHNDLLTVREAHDALLDVAVGVGLGLDAVLSILSPALERKSP